jgi:hypothetical protein
MSSKKRAHIVSSFKDSGTGENFTAGTTPLIDAGAYANYEAAGLVKAPPPAKTGEKPKQKPKGKPKPAAKAAKSAPAVPAEIPAPDAN